MQKGAVMAEAAIALPLFFLMLIAGAALLHGGYFVLAGYQAVNRTARVAMMGPKEQKHIADWETFLKDYLVSSGRELGLRIEAGEIDICPAANIDEHGKCKQPGAGKAGELVRIRWSTELLMRPMDFDAYVQNEPFA